MRGGFLNISLETTRAEMLRAIAPLPVETVPLAEAAGRVLAGEARARTDLPRFDNSAMDGYAVRAAEAATGAKLQCIGEVPAGSAFKGNVGEGECVRIQGGEEGAVKAGDFWRSPGGVPHGIRASAEGARILDVFSPPREEYKKAGKGFGGL